jgi:hypothetical protein
MTANRTSKNASTSASADPVDESCAVPDAPSAVRAPRPSAFKELGLQKTVSLLTEEIRELYLADDVPWIIGYSGGKDSTATLELVWLALAGLPSDKRRKTVHVISTDTLVENPVAAVWVSKSLGTALQALGKAGNALLKLYPKDWKKRLLAFGKIDWSRTNAKVWGGRALIGGKVSKVLTTHVIKSAFGLPLSLEERRVEDATLIKDKQRKGCPLGCRNLLFFYQWSLLNR